EQHPRGGQRNVEEEGPAPGRMFNEPSTEDRTERHRDGRESRPGAYGAAARIFVEGCADDGEAAGNEHSGADSLHGTCEHQEVNTWSRCADCGSERKDCDTKQEHQAAAQAVSERAASED